MVILARAPTKPLATPCSAHTGGRIQAINRLIAEQVDEQRDCESFFPVAALWHMDASVDQRMG